MILTMYLQARRDMTRALPSRSPPYSVEDRNKNFMDVGQAYQSENCMQFSNLQKNTK